MSADKMDRKTITARGEMGVVEDYLLFLLTVLTTNNPDTRERARRRANATMDVMTSAAANRALKVAVELELPWKPRGMN